MWMNEHDIDEALIIVGRNAPEFLPYVKFLSDWRDIINQNSDGWAYWKAGTRPASNLEDGIQKLMQSIRGHRVSPPSARDFDRALTPIRSFATRHKLPAPLLGAESAPSSGSVSVYDVGWLDSNGDHAYFLELTEGEVSSVKSELRTLQQLKHLREYHVTKVIPQMGFKDFLVELEQLFG